MKTQTVIKHFGSGRKLAKALGCSPQAISQWGEDVPPARAWQIQCITDGELLVEKKTRKRA